jgi:hypothetical protein
LPVVAFKAKPSDTAPPGVVEPDARLTATWAAAPPENTMASNKTAMSALCDKKYMRAPALADLDRCVDMNGFISSPQTIFSTLVL